MTCQKKPKTFEEFDERSSRLGLKSVMPFGQYKGKRIDYILTNDPQYLLWLSGKATTISFKKKVVKLAKLLTPDGNLMDYLGYDAVSEQEIY